MCGRWVPPIVWSSKSRCSCQINRGYGQSPQRCAATQESGTQSLCLTSTPNYEPILDLQLDIDSVTDQNSDSWVDRWVARPRDTQQPLEATADSKTSFTNLQRRLWRRAGSAKAHGMPGGCLQDQRRKWRSRSSSVGCCPACMPGATLQPF